MTYPNAFSGVKKIFLAQILMLIVAVLTFITACTGVVGIQETNSETVQVGALAAVGGLGIVIAILSIIAFIINLVGLSQAGKDERSFKTAFILTIIGLVLSIIDGIYTNSHPDSGGIFDLSTNVINVLVIILVINGVMALASKLNDEKLEKKGKNLLVIITIILIIALVLNIIGTFVGDKIGDGTAITFAVIGIVSAILFIVAYIMYLSLLSRAKKTLQK